MERFALGIDVSKGYADFHLKGQDGRSAPEWQRFDDTPAGQAAVQKLYQTFQDQHPGAHLLVGVEASGGLERNWLRLLRQLVSPPAGHVYRLNPLAVKRYVQRGLHGNINDPISARGIADYLLEGLRPADRPCDALEGGPVMLYRLTSDLIEHTSQLKNQLQSLLPSVQPDLVQHCRQDIPDWVLQLLGDYPTVEQLGRAHLMTLTRIPFVTPSRAARLVVQAQQSVASLRDKHTGFVVSALAQEIRRLQAQTKAFKTQLFHELKDDPEVKHCTSIPGIGPWTAVCLRLESGSLARFHSDNAVVAFAGLDPRVHKSGDVEQHLGISRCGRKQIRKALYMAALTAVRHNPAIQPFYARLRAAGKPHAVAITACMAKLLRIAYGCVLRDQDFDPQYHLEAEKRWQLAEAQRGAQSAPSPCADPATGPGTPAPPSASALGSLEAPISYREAKRRKTGSKKGGHPATTGFPQDKRGLGAARKNHTR
jgi:transposase